MSAGRGRLVATRESQSAKGGESPARGGGFCSWQRLHSAEFEAGQELKRPGGIQGFLLGLVERFDCFKVGILKLDVGGDRHRSQAVVAVGQFGGVAELAGGVRRPIWPVFASLAARWWVAVMTSRSMLRWATRTAVSA